MQLCFDATGEVDGFRRMATDLVRNESVKSIMVLACDGNNWSPSSIDPIVRALPVPLFGGLFPQIIWNGLHHERGTLVVGLSKRPDIVCIGNLSDPEADYCTALDAHAELLTQTGTGEDTLLVFVDGLGKRIGALVESLFDCFGLERNVIGGGAGSLSFVQKPCLITPTGIVADAALVVRLPAASGVGVSHGWQPISASMKVTEAERNTILTLDWQPAFEVYRRLVEAHSGRTFTGDNFFDLAKCYPFGINKMGSEVVVRDPLMVAPNGGLVCVGEVPRGSFVRLLHATPETLLDAVSRARQLAEQSLPETVAGEPVGLFIDCISRALFLGERMVDELRTAAAGGTMFGALTLGEIANNGRDYLEFYNKTAVLALLSADS